MFDNHRVLSRGVPDPARDKSPALDHVSHARPGTKALEEKLYVITPVSNPQRFRVRYELYRNFERHMEELGAILYTVELAQGNRPFEVTTAGNSRHIQLRTDHDMLWFKENMINVGLMHLRRQEPHASKVAWIDADVQFQRPDIMQETLQLLEVYKFVQMWSSMQDVGPNFEPIATRWSKSYMYNYVNGIGHDGKPVVSRADGCYAVTSKEAKQNGLPLSKEERDKYKGNVWYGPPGLAWAARMDALKDVGGLIDWGIVGSSDSYMALALIGQVQNGLVQRYHPRYKEWFMRWQSHAEQHIRRNVGVVEGMAIHYWHGRKENRKYIDRNDILIRHQFDPATDLKRDIQGLWQLVDHGDLRSIKLRDDLRDYFRQRNEDGTEV